MIERTIPLKRQKIIKIHVLLKLSVIGVTWINFSHLQNTSYTKSKTNISFSFFYVKLCLEGSCIIGRWIWTRICLIFAVIDKMLVIFLRCEVLNCTITLLFSQWNHYTVQPLHYRQISDVRWGPNKKTVYSVSQGKLFLVSLTLCTVS